MSPVQRSILSSSCPPSWATSDTAAPLVCWVDHNISIITTHTVEYWITVVRSESWGLPGYVQYTLGFLHIHIGVGHSPIHANICIYLNMWPGLQKSTTWTQSTPCYIFANIFSFEYSIPFPWISEESPLNSAVVVEILFC